MLDQSLLQSHFIGRDGFRWWIGQIPPASSLGKQSSGEGWGNRFKVRIIGYHPYSEEELSNEDLPWAQCLVPTTSGTGAANCSTGVQLQPGDIVFGFFLDGDNAQIPVILAAFGRTSSVPSVDYKGPFQPFTGYSSKINNPNPELQKNESNEKTEQPTPRDVSPEQAKKINKEEKSVSDAVGSKVILADPVGNTRRAAIKSEVSNVLKKIKKYQNNSSRIREEIKRTVDTISGISNDFVGVGFNFLYNSLIPILKEGLKLLYEKVYAIVLASTGSPYIAHLAGVAAQTAMVPPVKTLEEKISEIANEIVKDDITGVVTDMLNSTIGNIDKFTSPVELQFSTTLINSIIDITEVKMEDPLGGVSKLLQFFPNFSVGNTIRSAVDGIKTVGSAFDTNQTKESYQGLVTEWMVGANPIDVANNSFEKVLESMNIQKSGSKTTTPVGVINYDGINLGNLYAIVVLNNTVGVKDTKFVVDNVDDLIDGSIMTSTLESSDELIKISEINKDKNELTVKRKLSGISTSYAFGQQFYVFSNQSKVAKSKNKIKNGKKLIQSYSEVVSSSYTKSSNSAPPPTIKIFGGGRGKGAEAIPLIGNLVKDADGIVSGSIIGYQVTNQGSGYSIPPFVEIIDDIDSPQGYGAVARASIKDGKVVAIYSISEGENYTPNSNQVYSVVDVIIENSGEDYPNSVSVIDQFGNNYPTKTFEGKIISVSIDSLNNTVTDKPIITVNSSTGSGAILRPIIGISSITLQKSQQTVQTVIDCPI